MDFSSLKSCSKKVNTTRQQVKPSNKHIRVAIITKTENNYVGENSIAALEKPRD